MSDYATGFSGESFSRASYSTSEELAPPAERAPELVGEPAYRPPPDATGLEERKHPISRALGPRAGFRKLDASLLGRAEDVLGGLDVNDLADSSLAAEALICVLGELWETAVHSSAQHRALLAIAESAVRSWPVLSQNQVDVLRETVAYLSHGTVTESHVQSTRHSFVSAEWNPLAILGDLEDDE